MTANYDQGPPGPFSVMREPDGSVSLAMAQLFIARDRCISLAPYVNEENEGKRGIMEALIVAVGMGLLGGPAMAWALQRKNPRKRYEASKAKFLAGQGKDPDRSAVGPHQSFARNAIWLGLMMSIIGGFVGISSPN
jgi:hypothetical protein